MKSLFITGTGTEVGKTAVTAGLALLASSREIKTSLIKPVQTGTDDYPPDIEVVNAIVKDLVRLPAELEQPYGFTIPASPHLAAAEAGTRIKIAKIMNAYRADAYFENTELLLIEGAGGLYVPIVDNYFMIDLIKDMKAPAILTTLPDLGTLNHTLLSLKALESKGIPVAAIIINMCSDNPDLIEMDNYKTIAKYAGNIPVVTVKKVPGYPESPQKEVDKTFIENLLDNFNNENLIKAIS